MPKKIRRMDVSCRLYFLADIDETLLERGTGFALSVMRAEALRILKTGKSGKDFHLDVVSAHELPAHGQPVVVEERGDVEAPESEGGNG